MVCVEQGSDDLMVSDNKWRPMVDAVLYTPEKIETQRECYPTVSRVVLAHRYRT